jgi:hypothetical protein
MTTHPYFNNETEHFITTTEDFNFTIPASPAPGSSISQVTTSSIHELSPTSTAGPQPRSKKKRLRTIRATVWQYFRDPKDDEVDFKGPARCWYCKRCGHMEYVVANVENHLKNEHDIRVGAHVLKATGQGQSSIETGFAKQMHNTNASGQNKIINLLRQAVDIKAYREAEIRLAVRRRLPLRFVEWPEYYKLLQAVNPRIDYFATKSTKTLMNNIRTLLDTNCLSLRERFKTVLGLIHFSMDMWTSGRNFGFLAVTVQWIDKKFKK